MGLVDTFGAEDRVQVKFSDFYKLMKQAAQYEIAMNAVGCDVPHRYIKEMMTGKSEAAEVQSTEIDTQDKRIAKLLKEKQCGNE